MPNWCSTSYMIEGPHETLQKINDAILHHEVQENSSPDWEGNVLLALGITWEQSTPDGKGYYMRGFIQDSPSLGKGTLEFYAEEAWGVTDFNEVLEKNFPDIKVYFVAEEPGNEVYVTNDAEGKYFPARYYVDTCIHNNYESEYFIKEEDVYSWLSKITENKIKTLEDVEKFNEDSIYNDDFITINKFKIVE